MAIGHGAAEIMFMYVAIGRDHGPEELGYAADGTIVHAVIPGIEGIGDSPPSPLKGL